MISEARAEIRSTAGPEPVPPGVRASMDSDAWLRYFQDNRHDRPEPQWHVPCSVDAATAPKLARSLSHFQLGESGEGTSLLAEARRACPDDPRYVEALALFVGEEQEHARLLERLVARFQGTLITRHWTHSCFRRLRRALGVRFEIQTLVIAEVIGAVYYRLLHRQAGDVVLGQVCELMLRDEGPHLEFHAACITRWQAPWLPLERCPLSPPRVDRQSPDPSSTRKPCTGRPVPSCGASTRLPQSMS